MIVYSLIANIVPIIYKASCIHFIVYTGLVLKAESDPDTK
jgi:hypothetical protein